jgi:hypothetical protein
MIFPGDVSGWTDRTRTTLLIGPLNKFGPTLEVRTGPNLSHDSVNVHYDFNRRRPRFPRP